MNRNKFNPHKLDRDGKPYNVVPKRLRVRVYKILHEKIVVQKNNLGGLCEQLKELEEQKLILTDNIYLELIK